MNKVDDIKSTNPNKINKVIFFHYRYKDIEERYDRKTEHLYYNQYTLIMINNIKNDKQRRKHFN